MHIARALRLAGYPLVLAVGEPLWMRPFSCDQIMTNALRHARARNLWITIASEGGAITLEAYDDGRGATEVRTGQGLGGMRARLEELGGCLNVAVDDPARAFADPAPP